MLAAFHMWRFGPHEGVALTHKACTDPHNERWYVYEGAWMLIRDPTRTVDPPPEAHALD